MVFTPNELINSSNTKLPNVQNHISILINLSIGNLIFFFRYPNYMIIGGLLLNSNEKISCLND